MYISQNMCYDGEFFLFLFFFIELRKFSIIYWLPHDFVIISTRMIFFLFSHKMMAIISIISGRYYNFTFFFFSFFFWCSTNVYYTSMCFLFRSIPIYSFFLTSFSLFLLFFFASSRSDRMCVIEKNGRIENLIYANDFSTCTMFFSFILAV